MKQEDGRMVAIDLPRVTLPVVQPQLQKETLHAVVHAAIEYVTLEPNFQEGAESDIDKGAFFGDFLYHDPAARFRGMVALESIWLGGSKNRADIQKFQFIMPYKVSRLSCHGPEMLFHRDRNTLASSENRALKGAPPGAIMFSCRIPGFLHGKRAWKAMGLSGLYGPRDEASLLVAANNMRCHSNPDVRWDIDLNHLREIPIAGNSPYREFLLEEVLVN